MKKYALMCLLALAGCDNKPAHYLVLCDQQDGQGWTLSNFVKKDGYIVSCTYQSPDRQASYSRVCDSIGCDIKK